MAASGVMSDFAKMPTQRKVMVFVIAALALGGLYYQFMFKQLSADLQEAEADGQSKVQLNKKLAADIPKYEELKSRMKELTQMITENQKALPTEAEVPAFFETLERKVTESGVEIKTWKKLPESPVESFVRVPVQIELTGTFMQIKRFFASLVQKGVVQLGEGVEERERIVSIENLSLVEPHVVNREMVMSAKFTAVTFRQEDKAEVAPTPGAKPATTPTGPATPPMPSAATPQGAKARVENSLDKGDAANRNATGVDEAKTPAGGGSDRLKGGM